MKGIRSNVAFPTFVFARAHMSSKTPKKMNHYETLEINKSATQNEIKSAYFKLSKVYHPDLNSSSEAEKKFCDISEAYEVLGNFNSRKIYDRSLQFQSISRDNVSTYSSEPKPQVRRQKTVVRDIRKHDQNPIYDFDTWTKAHYGYSFRKQQKTSKKRRSDNTENYKKDHDLHQILGVYDSTHQYLILILPFLIFGLILFKGTMSTLYVSESQLMKIKDRQNSLKTDTAEQSAKVQRAIGH